MCINEIIRNIHKSRHSGFIKDSGKKIKMIGEIIGTDEQGEKVQKQDLTSPVSVSVRIDLPRVLTTCQGF